jgi:hypothetical protein
MTTSKSPTPTLREAESEFDAAVGDLLRCGNPAPQMGGLPPGLQKHLNAVNAAARAWVAAARTSALEEAAQIAEYYENDHEAGEIAADEGICSARIRALKEQGNE